MDSSSVFRSSNLLQFEVSTFDEWRTSARRCLKNHIAPGQIEWTDARDRTQTDSLLEAVPATSASLSSDENAVAGVISISRELMDLVRQAAMYRDHGRWSFLYQIVWRYAQGEHDVASAADVDGQRLHQWVKAVRREIHDMHAYVRFRERDAGAGPPRFVAWFEPAHDVLAATGDHFARRMGQHSWMIATPDAALACDGDSWHLVPPVESAAVETGDVAEGLWLTYYRSIFNPSRLNEKIMHGHIRQRFWKHLPEAEVVPDMISSAKTGSQKSGQAPAVSQRSEGQGMVIPVRAAQDVIARGASRQLHSGSPGSCTAGDEASSLAQCRRCHLWQDATQAVPGRGRPDAAIMIVGEQPGDQEDLAGEPFVGPAGNVLDRAFAQAGLDRADLYITNAVKHFKWEPRGKRRLHKTPAQQEVDACYHWLQRELHSVQPRVVVTLGATALKAVTQNQRATLKERLGRSFVLQVTPPTPNLSGNLTTPSGQTDEPLLSTQAIAVYHPSYILRLPDQAQQDEAFQQIVSGLLQAKQFCADHLPS